MNLLFEESGDFKAGTVLSQHGATYQVEVFSGKRSKVKIKDVVLQFITPTPSKLMEDARLIANEIDLNFLWEVAGEKEFIFIDLGNEYFGHVPLPHEAAGLLLRLHSSPVYFYRKGKGRYKAASQVALQAALVRLEKKKQQTLLQMQYVKELKSGKLPVAFQSQVLQLLFRPEKNGIEFKALEIVCKNLRTTPTRLMLKIGGLQSSKDVHYAKFLFHYFPNGSNFPQFDIPIFNRCLPVANVQAFSIDDITTTEIDDALSVVLLEDNKVRIGIHIAAPGLTIQRDDKLDLIARQRMSTIYIPGEKITMLPDILVKNFTLNAGKNCPALSLYITLNKKNWSIIAIDSRAEIVPIITNLRHNDLDMIVTKEALAANSGHYPHKNDIALLWQWAQILEQKRIVKRENFGLRPIQTNRVDFNFYINDNNNVVITRRKREAPLDKIVAELMIFANSTWGKLMHDHGVPGIYRIQNRNLANKMQVRMATHAAPHQGLGVDQYAWSTSPLRRYTDLVNQWQILACLEYGSTAQFFAPFKPHDVDLLSIVTTFDSIYTNYSLFQSEMERYWCLRWLSQEQLTQVDAIVLKDGVLRLIDIPLIIHLPGMPLIARGIQVKLDLLNWDEVDLTVEVRLHNIT